MFISSVFVSVESTVARGGQDPEVVCDTFLLIVGTTTIHDEQQQFYSLNGRLVSQSALSHLLCWGRSLIQERTPR